jgi:hypothetical protein
MHFLPYDADHALPLIVKLAIDSPASLIIGRPHDISELSH